MTENSKINFEDTATAFAHKTNKELKKSHFVYSTMNYPLIVKAGTLATTFALKAKIPVKKLIKKTLFDQFCGGESIEGSEPRMIKLAEARVKTILDYSVEGEKSEESFDQAMEEALSVSKYAEQHVSIPFCVIKMTGVGSFDILAKKQSGEKLTLIEEVTYEKILYRIEKIVEQASKRGMKFMIDAEESWIQDEVDNISYSLMKKFNKEKAVVYNTYQLYRHDTLENMKRGFEEVTKAGVFFAAKLVRGAYMEKERDRAEELGYESPIQPDKKSTDRDYNLALQFAIENISRFSICAGTHNEESCQFLVNLMDAHGIAKSDERVYFAQLLGMSDNISFKLADMGYNVGKYVPYGPVEKVLPYLFRRAAENTSIAGQSSREFLLVKKELKRRKQG
ncbi:MAG: proline dehydrogenase family protein [Cyclobacteriaceae bacterium]